MIRPLSAVVRDHVLEALRLCEGDKERAARALGISLKTLYNMLHRWGVFNEWAVRRRERPVRHRDWRTASNG